MAVPKLRFKADDGSEFSDWEKFTLGDVTSEFKSGKNIKASLITSDGDYPVYGGNGLRGYTENFNHDGVYAIIGRQGALCGNMTLVSGKTYLTEHAIAVDGNAKNSTLFLYYLLITMRLGQYSDQGAQPGLAVNKLLKLTNMFPSLPEQRKIASFLSTIDDIITRTETELTVWQERKKGVMQKIFNREVRFKAYDGSEFPEWEEKKFADVFENMNNNTFSRDCLNYGFGFAKNIHYGDILVKFNSYVDVMNDEIPYINKELSYSKYSCLQDGDIVIADTAEDETVGKAVEIENTNNMAVVAGLHTIACRPKMKFAKRYLGYYLNSDTYHMQLRPYMQGIKVTSISKSNISLTKIIVPSLPEQKKIADCLSSLDDVINQIQAELSAWKEFKKGLLQQMFV